MTNQTNANPIIHKPQATGLRLHTGVKAGIIRVPIGNHNETLASATASQPACERPRQIVTGLRIQTGVKAGFGTTASSTEDKHKDW